MVILRDSVEAWLTSADSYELQDPSDMKMDPSVEK